LKLVEAIQPEGLVMGDPIHQWSKASWLDPVESEATLAPFRHEACVAQGREVLRYGRLGDIEPFRKVFDRRLPSRQTLEDGATGRISQGPEDGVLALHERSYKASLIPRQARRHQ
jgi:hypothetical protein